MSETTENFSSNNEEQEKPVNNRHHNNNYRNNRHHNNNNRNNYNNRNNNRNNYNNRNNNNFRQNSDESRDNEGYHQRGIGRRRGSGRGNFNNIGDRDGNSRRRNENREDERGQNNNRRYENRNNDRGERGRGGRHGGRNMRRKKNTECFEPSDEPMDMRIMIGNGNQEKYGYEIGNRDVILVNDLFCKEYDLDIYTQLVKEVKECGIDMDKLFKLWHGDTHYIADDKLNWKEKCPTFTMVIDKIREYFNMDIKATRFNWYKDLSEWKPYHHDAAAVKKDKMDTQNFTVGVSFGAKRIAGFEHAQHRTKISVPLANGTCYCFSKDTNIEWRHGIPQIDSEAINGEEGRISIIAWGWTDLAK